MDFPDWNTLMERGGFFVILVGILFGGFKAVRGFWEFCKPYIARWFESQVELTETLIARNKQQEVSDEITLKTVKDLCSTQLGRQHACDLAVHACDAASEIFKAMEISEAEEPISRLRTMVDSVRSAKE